MIKTLKNKNFFLIITGKLISLMGNSIFDIALMWYVLSIYGKASGTMLALIMLMSILPTVVLGSVVGSLIDRYNRKLIMIISDLTAGVVVFAVYALMRNGMLNSFELLASVGILSVATSAVRISVTSIIPDIFRDKELYDANGTNQFVERGTALLGYALGGALLALVGVENAILFNAISFILCVALEIFLALPQKENTNENGEKQSLLKDFVEVKQYLKENKRMLRIVLVFTTVNFFLDPLFNIAMPYMLKNIFNVSSVNLGLTIASLPLGFCIGAVYFSRRSSFLLNKFVLFNSVFAINILSVFFVVPVILANYLAAAKWVPYYFMLCLLISGVFSAAINISANVAIQRSVPDSIRGKFMGISSSLSAGLLPLGSVIIGAVIGIVSPAIIYSISILAIFALIFLIPKTTYSFD